MDLGIDYGRLTTPVLQSSYCSQRHAERTRFTPIGSLDIISEKFKQIVLKPLLCWHDVDDLNQIYYFVDGTLRDNWSVSVTTTQLLTIVIRRIKRVLSKKPGDRALEDILSVYYLHNFTEQIGIQWPFTCNFSEKEKEKIISKMPFCCSVESFNRDVNFFIGDTTNERIIQVIQQKRKLLLEDKNRKQEIETKRSELLHRQKENPGVLPLYLNQILDYGCLSLYVHMCEMKELKSRNARIEACEAISFSKLSQIVLDTRSAIMRYVDEAIPANHRECEIIFLLGGSGAGKSTALCFLRGDRMELQGSTYISTDDIEGSISDKNTVSCTFLPNVEVIGQRVIVDFPGFDDSHGSYISLGMELALKGLVSNYNPKVIVLESITNIEGKYEAAARLGTRLSRLFLNKEKCLLGITKYSCDPDFIRLSEVETKQRKELSSPSDEEVGLQAQIVALESHVAGTPELGSLLSEKKLALAELERKRIIASQTNYTEEKQQLTLAIEEKENILKAQIGIQQVIRFSDLEQADCIQILSFLSEFEEKAVVNPQLSLGCEYEQLLQERFQNGLKIEIEAAQATPSNVIHIDELKQKILETSLVSAITPWSPSIGQFLHLPEMDKSIARGYSKAIVTNCISYLIEAIVIEGQISKFKYFFDKFQSYDLTNELKKEIDRLKQYILKFYGLEYVLDQPTEEIEAAWNGLEKRIKGIRRRVHKYQQGGRLAMALMAPVLLPAAICFVPIEEAPQAVKLVGILWHLKKQATENLISTSLKEIKELYNQIVQLKEIEKVIEKQEEIDLAFTSTELSLESEQKLLDSLHKKINCIRDIYGHLDWDARLISLKKPTSWEKKLRLIIAALLLDDAVSVEKINFNSAFSIEQFWGRCAASKRKINLVKNDITLPIKVKTTFETFCSFHGRLFSSANQSQLLEYDLRNPLHRTLLAACLMKK